MITCQIFDALKFLESFMDFLTKPIFEQVPGDDNISTAEKLAVLN